MVPFVDVRVRLRVVGDGPVELVARPEIGRDGGGIARAGVGPRQRPAADAAVDMVGVVVGPPDA